MQVKQNRLDFDRVLLQGEGGGYVQVTEGHGT